MTHDFLQFLESPFNQKKKQKQKTKKLIGVFLFIQNDIFATCSSWYHFRYH